VNQNSLLGNRNFQLHWFSSIISQVCGFFSFVALPWLVLSITENNPFVMSTVLATSSLPQAFFMIFGGVFADRFSPLKMLFVSRLLFALLMASLAAVVYLNCYSMLMIYFYAFVLGTLSALMIPASQALLPSMLPKSHLAAANGLIMASAQIAQVVGMVLAGWVIWYVKKIHGVAENQADTSAFAVAFAVDCMGASAAIVLMYFIRADLTYKNEETFMVMLKQGLLFCWRDKGVALVLVYIMLVSFFLQGVLVAGLPIFTKLHLGLAEFTYSNLYALMGVGVILGVGIGVLLKPSSGQMGLLILVCDFVSGMGFFMLGRTSHFFSAGLCLLLMGICAGIVMVAGTTWFQNRTPDFLMGRVLGILMFTIVGLVPISASITGFLMMYFPATLVISTAGGIIVFFSLVGLLVPSIRKMGFIPPINFNWIDAQSILRSPAQ
jgi:MFS family permease